MAETRRRSPSHRHRWVSRRCQCHPPPGYCSSNGYPAYRWLVGAYPDAPLSSAAAAALLRAAGALVDWTAPLVFTPVIDYPRRILRYGPAGQGVLGADTVMALLR